MAFTIPGLQETNTRIRRGSIGVFCRYVLLDAHSVSSPIAATEGGGKRYAQMPWRL